jgi:hypothetical protein
MAGGMLDLESKKKALHTGRHQQKRERDRILASKSVAVDANVRSFGLGEKYAVLIHDADISRQRATAR